MSYTLQLLDRIKDVVESGYYQRLAPAHREKKSLCEKIEAMQDEGELPIISQISTAIPSIGLLMPSRKYATNLIDRIADSYNLCAVDLWVEPREHAGDLRWLAKDLKIPIIHNDWIIDPRQIVGADAVVLDISLINFANVDLHELVDTAHEKGMEVIAQIRNEDEMSDAKKSEADCIMINNFADSKTSANIQTTINALEKNGTGRPVISSYGINTAKEVRTLIMKGVSAIEIEAQICCNGSFEKKLSIMRSALKGKNANETT
jgi:indole-3-glycerol phosphate synthase